MKIAICDDDGNAIDFLKQKIELQKNKDDIAVFMNPGEMTPVGMGRFDLIFLDIEMPGMDGLELAGLLRAKQADADIPGYGSLPLIVFVTGHKEYMQKAFSVHAFDYLLKPVSDEAFLAVYNKAGEAARHLRVKNLVVKIKTAGESYSVPAERIVYVESQSRKNILHLKTGERIEYYGAMRELEDELDNRFFRIHKGFIVNMMHIQKYDRTSVMVTTGETILMSKYRYRDFASSYLDYLRRKEGRL